MEDVYTSAHWIKFPTCQECPKRAEIVYTWQNVASGWFTGAEETYYCRDCAEQLGIELPPEPAEEKEEEEEEE